MSKNKRNSITNPSSIFFSHKLLVLATLAICIIIIPLTVTSLTMKKNVYTHASSNNLTASGTNLLLNGKITQFTGVNAYEIATNLNVNPGCGPTVTNPDTFFSKLRQTSLVRIWGFEGSMTKYNPNTKQFDWSALDAVLASATKYNQLVILSIGNQWGTCDDNRYKDINFYNGGYMNVYNPNGTTPVSYWNYMQAIVNHFKFNSALGMWELMNEPEAKDSATGSCNEANAANALRSFFDNVGKKLKSLDPNHLIESGILGSGQCGTSGGDYQFVHATSGVDVASYHDYGADNSPMPGDQYNGLQVRLNQMKKDNKPLIIGEVGMKAHNNITNCMTLSHRVTLMNNKMNAQFPAGIDAFLPWDWMPQNTNQCIYETITYNDPLMSLLYNYPLLGNTPAGTTLQNTIDTISSSAQFSDLPLQVAVLEPEVNMQLNPGQTINLTAAISGNNNGSIVSFYENNSFVCSSSGTPFACSWTIPFGINMQYTIIAKAVDSYGNTAISLPVAITTRE